MVYNFHMLFSIENLDAILYLFQQIGVMLSVGAETVILSAFVLAMEDGAVDATEAKFSRAVRRALAAGLGCIIVSGLLITAVHGSLGEGSIIFQPVFLAKWSLILLLLAAYVLQWKRPFLNFWLEGVVGGTWYALFLLHIMAPLTSWLALLIMYTVFMSIFMGIWALIVFLMRRAHAAYGAGPRPEPIVPPVQSPSPIVQTLPPAPKPVVQAPPPKPPVVVPVVVEPPPPPPVSKPAPVLQPVAAAVLPPPPPSKPVAAPLAVPSPMKEAQSNPLPTSMPQVYVPKAASPLPVPAVSAVIETDPHNSPWLPAIHVMPKTKEALDAKSHMIPRAAIIKHA